MTRHARPTLALAVLGVLGVLGVSGLPTIATSAVDALEPPDTERYVSWGPLRVRPGFELQRFGYDSNVFNREEPTGDYRATVAPKLDGLVLLGRRAFATFEGEFRYTAYRRFTRLNYFDTLSAVEVTVPLRRFGLFVRGGYDREREIPVDETDVRPVRRTESYGAGLVVRLGWRSDLTLSREAESLAYTDDDFARTDFSIGDQLDRTERFTRASFGYGFTDRTRLTLDAEWGSIDFVRPTLLAGDGFERNGAQRRLLPGIELATGGPLSGKLRVGYARIDFDGAELRDYEGWIGDARIQARAGQRVTLTIEGRRRVDFSISDGNNFFVYDRLRLNAVGYLSRYFGLEAEVARGRLRVPDVDRTDRILELAGGVRLRLSRDSLDRRIEYAIRYGRIRRESTDLFRDRERDTFDVRAIVGF